MEGLQEYKRQQTEEGQQALRVQKEYARKLQERQITSGKLKVGELRPLINLQTGKVEKYFVSE